MLIPNLNAKHIDSGYDIIQCIVLPREITQPGFFFILILKYQIVNARALVIRFCIDIEQAAFARGAGNSKC